MSERSRGRQSLGWSRLQRPRERDDVSAHPGAGALAGGRAVTLGLFTDLRGAAAPPSCGRGLADRPRWRRPLILAGYAIAALTRPVDRREHAAWQVITPAPRIAWGRASARRRGSGHRRCDLRGNAGARPFGFTGRWTTRARWSAAGGVGVATRAHLTPDGVIVWSVVLGDRRPRGVVGHEGAHGRTAQGGRSSTAESPYGLLRAPHRPVPPVF